jgi:hypothetical protein
MVFYDRLEVLVSVSKLEFPSTDEHVFFSEVETFALQNDDDDDDDDSYIGNFGSSIHNRLNVVRCMIYAAEY